MKRYVFALLILGAALPCSAQDGGTSGSASFFFSPALFFNSDSQARNATAQTTNLLVDFRLGFSLAPEIYAGFYYGLDNKNVKTSGYATSTNNYDNKYERKSYGPFVGYFLENFYTMFTFILNSEWQIRSSTEGAPSKYEGLGIHLDAGFKFPLWGFYFGPQVTYKHYTYSKLSSGGSSESLSPTLKQSKVDIMLATWVYF